MSGPSPFQELSPLPILEEVLTELHNEEVSSLTSSPFSCGTATVQAMGLREMADEKEAWVSPDQLAPTSTQLNLKQEVQLALCLESEPTVGHSMSYLEMLGIDTN